MAKIKIDGKMYDNVPDEAVNLMSAQQARIDELERVESTTQARMDEAEAKLYEAETTRMDEAEIRAAVKARTSLERKAAAVLGNSTRFDEMDDLALMSAVISKRHPKADLKDKDPAYIRARFDAATEELSAEAIGAVRKAVDNPSQQRTDAEDPDVRAKKAREELHNRAKQPLRYSAK